MELNDAAAALPMPQAKAASEMDSAPNRPWVARKKTPSMARAMAASARRSGQRRPISASHTATIAGAVNCNTVAVALLEALIAAI